MFVCVYVHVDSFTQMSIATAVNEYTVGFTHISSCPTISDVKVCLILYNTLALLVKMYIFICTYIRN